MKRKRWPKVEIGCSSLVVLAVLVWVVWSFVDTRKDRQVQCLSNLHFIGQALVLYRDDKGAFPPFSFAAKGPGLKALVDLEYLEKYEGSARELICPDNEAETDSYDVFEGKVVYNYWGYGRDRGKWTGYSLKANAVPDKSDRKRRYLAYPKCPGDTIITHCCYHRAFHGSNRAAWVDLVLRLYGDVDKVSTVKTFPGLKER